jgi:hypothetical protein
MGDGAVTAQTQVFAGEPFFYLLFPILIQGGHINDVKFYRHFCSSVSIS